MDAIPLHRRPTSLNAMLTSIASMMEPYASDIGVKLKIELGPELPASLALDEDKIAWASARSSATLEGHGGRMEAESTDDPHTHGTTIRLVLPAP